MIPFVELELKISVSSVLELFEIPRIPNPQLIKHYAQPLFANPLKYFSSNKA